MSQFEHTGSNNTVVESVAIKPKEIISPETLKMLFGSGVVVKKKDSLGSGVDLYELKPDLIARVSVWESGKNNFQTEKWCLDQCAKAKIPVPKIIGLTTVPEGRVYKDICIESKLPGKPLEEVVKNLDTKSKENILSEAGGVLSKIHSINVGGFGLLNENGEGQFSNIAEMLNDPYIEKNKMLEFGKKVSFDKNIMLRSFEILNSGKELYDGFFQPKLLHNDFDPKHILVENNKVSGITGFGLARGGDPVMDLARWHFFSESKFPVENLMQKNQDGKGYLDKKIFDHKFDEKFNLWRLYSGMMHLSWASQKGDKKEIEFSKQQIGNDVAWYEKNFSDAAKKIKKQELLKKFNETSSYFEKDINGKKVFVDKNGDPVKRSLEREKTGIEDYFNKQDPGYISELKNFARGVEKMHEKCRVSVIIPARFEEKNLANLLDQYCKQVDPKGVPINKDLFEINIIINRKVGEVADKSIDVVENWKKKNPGYHVNYINIEFTKEKANVGVARKYITDLSLLRSIERPKTDGPLYIESEDADLTAIDKRTIHRVIEGFDKKPYLDVLRGTQDRQPEIMQKNELLFFQRRIWDFVEVFMRKEAYRPENMKGGSLDWNRVISGGWNTAYTAEAYAKIGGYEPDLMGEDMKIGRKISKMRGYKDAQNNEVINTKTAETSGLRSNSSPRRFLDAMARQANPYADFENQSIKEKTNDELLNSIKHFEKASLSQKNKYEEQLNILRGFITGEMKKEPEATEVFNRVLWATGLKNGDYIVKQNKTLELTEQGMKNIISLFEKYKNEKRHLRGYKNRQNSTVKD